MFKQLLIIALLVGGVWLYRRWRRLVSRAPGRSAPSYRETVRCGHCGIHIPRAEAIAGEQGYFCSEAHRLARQADIEKGRR